MAKKAKKRELANIASSSNPLPPPSTTSAPPALSASPVTAPTPPSYKPITDDASIERLVGLAKDSPPDSTLGIVWQHAFEEGKRLGYSDSAKLFKGADISEITNVAAERGIEIGRAREKRAWGAAGHSTTCITVARPPRGIAVQTDEISPRPMATTAVQIDTPKPPPTPRSTPNTADSAIQTTPLGIQDASSQTLPHPSLIPDSIRTTSPPPTSLNWADDAASLPILSSQPPLRDLSALRSSSPKPFSSLQRRNKRSQTHFSQPFHDYTLFPTPCRTFSRRRFPAPCFSSIPFRSARVHPHRTPRFSSTSALNWEADPRLFELSQALNALGWVRH